MPEDITQQSDPQINVVVGQNIDARQASQNRKHWVVGFSAVIIVGVLIGAGWGYIDYKKSQQVAADNLSAVQNKAEMSVKSSNNTSKGLKVYNTAISNATSNATKGSLDMQAAELALNNNMLTSALSYALQADGLLHTDNSTSLVATVYQQQGNDTQAVIYFKKAAAEVNPALPGGNTKQYYLDQAQAAAAGVKQ